MERTFSITSSPPDMNSSSSGWLIPRTSPFSGMSAAEEDPPRISR